MKKLFYVLPVLIFSLFMNVNAKTSLDLQGEESIDYGKTISYDVILKTDEDVTGFQFDLNIDKNLTLLSYQSNIEGLIVKVSNDKTKIIGYGKTLKNNDNILTLVFNTKELEETTTVNTKVNNDIYVSLNNNKVTGDGGSVNTKVIVPVKEEETPTSSTTTSTSSSSSSNTKKTNVKKEENKKEEVKVKEEEKDDSKKEETKKESKLSKIVKIIIIILLGLLILYLLNKETNDDEITTEEVNKNKK